MKSMTLNPGGTPANTPTPALLDVKQAAALLDCSPRHVARLADTGKMPASIKLGALTRWRRADLERWIESGCRPVRNAGGVR